MRFRRRLRHWLRNLRIRARLRRAGPYPVVVRWAEEIADAAQARLEDER